MRLEVLTAREPETNPKHAGWSTRWCDELDHQLESWRDILPQDYQWSDDDPPASDINAARMRAKYYGARYLIHRPFLHHTLHPVLYRNAHGMQTSQSPSTAFTDRNYHASMTEAQAGTTMAYSATKQKGYMGPPASIKLEEVDPKVMQASEICVKAAIQSTIAFDGVERRPIVTNIFGTAHAYVPRSLSVLFVLFLFCCRCFG